MINLGPFRDQNPDFFSEIIMSYLGDGVHLQIANVKCEKEIHFYNYFSKTLQLVKIDSEALKLLSSSGFELIMDGSKSRLRNEDEFKAYINDE